jgi:hypothetical protein
MVYRRIIIPAILVALVSTATVRADMVVTCEPQVACGGALPLPSLAEAQAADLPSLLPGFDMIDLSPFSMTAFWPEANNTDEQAAQAATSAGILLDRDRGSLEWCVYALMGFGLCKYAPMVRKLSLGFVPDWYHSGAPQQIGHSHAVGPDAFCHAAVCFIQPGGPLAVSLLRYGWSASEHPARSSQFTPSTHASRGPPHMS